MFIPRVSAIGIGVSALATGIGLGVTTSLPTQPAPGWGTMPSTDRFVAGAATLAALFTTVGFGLASPMKGLKPVGAMVGALVGATTLGIGGSNLLKPHPAPKQR